MDISHTPELAAEESGRGRQEKRREEKRRRESSGKQGRKRAMA